MANPFDVQRIYMEGRFAASPPRQPSRLDCASLPLRPSLELAPSVTDSMIARLSVWMHVCLLARMASRPYESFRELAAMSTNGSKGGCGSTCRPKRFALTQTISYDSETKCERNAQSTHRADGHTE